MYEQRIGLFLWILRPGQRAALPAILRILDRVLIGDVGLAEPLDADAKARGVHHHEHRGEAFILLADHPALGAVIIHHRSEEHTSELQSLMRISYAVFCLQKKTKISTHTHNY